MRKIDFLSEFPNLFIFQKERHKTNFGGVLFLIYIIIMIIISSSYIIDFVINDKFEIESLSINNLTKIEDIEILNNINDYNPITDFRISIPIEIYTDRFRVRYVDENNQIRLENVSEYYYNPTFKQLNFSGEAMSFSFKSKITGFEAELIGYCGTGEITSCSDLIDILEHKIIFIGFESLFPKIDHQNPLKPILDLEKYSQFNILGTPFPSQISYDFIYRVVQYKEKKGLSRIFDKLLELKNEYFSGYLIFESSDEFILIDRRIDGDLYRYMMNITIDNPHETYDEYKRKRRTELDVLSTISALFTPVRLVFLIIYRFYAKKFNNYKIIENILTQKPKKLIELKNISEIKDSPLKDLNDNEKQEILIKSEIEEKPDENTEESNEEKKDSNENNSDKDTKGITLPKYFFGQFFLNNIYCQCCKRRKCLKEFNKYHQQDILELCNTINMKYLSLNSLLYNQIMIENLLKDYNWNNSSLNNIKNNELILKLQTLIE